MDMREALRAIAVRCRILARGCTDRYVSDRLIDLAIQYEARIAVLDRIDGVRREGGAIPERAPGSRKLSSRSFVPH